MTTSGGNKRRRYRPPDWVRQGFALEESLFGNAMSTNRQIVSGGNLLTPTRQVLTRVVEWPELAQHWTTLGKTDGAEALVAQIAAVIRRSQDPRGVTQKRVRRQLARQINEAAESYTAGWQTILATRDAHEAVRAVWPSLHRDGIAPWADKLERHLAEVRSLAGSISAWAAVDNSNTHKSKPQNRRAELVVQLTDLMRAYLGKPCPRLVADIANVVFLELPSLNEAHVIKLRR